jgi:prevent-host-death family protein
MFIINNSFFRNVLVVVAFERNNATIVIATKELWIMPNIKPVSDLRNYNEVLRDISAGEPVFLTKNGRGCYVLLDIAEYEKIQATIKLLSELSEAEIAAKNGDWLSSEEVQESLGI